MRFLLIQSLFLFVIGINAQKITFEHAPVKRNMLSDLGSFGEKLSNLKCDTCRVILPVVRLLISKNDTSYLSTICSKLKIEDSTVCQSIIALYQDSIIKVAKFSPLSDSELCSAILNCSPITNPVFDWNITLPNIPKPAVKPFISPNPYSPKLRILHLSDLHIDYEYQPGSVAKCGQPLCCRNSSTVKTIRRNKIKHNLYVKENEVSSAGHWGDYRNCDTPIWTVENMFDHIAKNEQFDIIYMTGDIPPHNIWNQTKADQLNAVDKLTKLFLKYFPNKIIYSTLGNHEAAPCNLFPTDTKNEDNITWLYSALAESWTHIGLPTDLKKQISTGAFYTIEMAPGLRLISLNMNYCYNLNFWLLIDSVDPLGQLSWLVDILQKSENNGEKVHIIGHVDPNGCFESWSKSYYEIINRYESTIAGQFFGHTHFDQFEMFYDLKNHSRAVSTAYIAGSVTAYNRDNPNYRIYIVDGNYTDTSWEVLDHETYYMNLTEANLSMKPVWKKEYSAKEAFNLKSLQPQEWGNLLDEMLNDLNGDLVDKLINFYSSSADGIAKCDLKCRRTFVCTFKQARSDGFIAC